MDLPFQDHPDSVDVRRIILAEIERMQALFAASVRPGAANTFEWWGQRHWVDQERWLVVRASDAKRYPGATTLPLSADTEDTLEVYGGESRQLFGDDAISVFSWLISDTLEKNCWWPTTTHLFNLLAVQPLVNPACAPLFWVALNHVMFHNASDDVMAILRPLTFDMSSYPASRSAARQVRAAQAEFFRAQAAQPPPDWASLDDPAWAEACSELVRQARCGIESHVFDLILARARAIRLGLRPF